MWRNILLVAFALSLVSCRRTPSSLPESYQSLTDQWIARLGLPAIGIWPCREGYRTVDGQKTYVPPEVEDCYKMEPPHRWHGTWVTEFEAARFCPSVKQACSWEKPPRYELWYNTRMFTLRPQIGAEVNREYALDFVGRRTKYPVGDWDPHYEIVVDRLISMKDMGALQRK